VTNAFDNPWIEHEAFCEGWVLRSDLAAVKKYQAKQSRKIEHRLQTHVVPEPWCGPLKSAAVLALSGNPHWDDRDEGMPSIAFTLMEENLSGDRSMFWLDRRLRGLSGSVWYRSRLLLDVLEVVNEESVASNFCLVDFVGYRSHQWNHSLRVPSQGFTIQEVEAAMRRRAVIVITRGVQPWLKAVPALRSYPLVFLNSSPMAVRISERNTRLCLDGGEGPGFETVIDRLTNG